jgi:hypothetical protein
MRLGWPPSTFLMTPDWRHAPWNPARFSTAFPWSERTQLTVDIVKFDRLFVAELKMISRGPVSAGEHGRMPQDRHVLA